MASPEKEPLGEKSPNDPEYATDSSSEGRIGGSVDVVEGRKARRKYETQALLLHCNIVRD